jgi:hypothetical protein
MRKTAGEFLAWLYGLPSSEVANTLAIVGVLINIGLLFATTVLAIYSYRQWKVVDDTLREIKQQTPAVLQSGNAAELSAKIAVAEAASSDASTQTALGEMKKQSKAAQVLASATQAATATAMKQLDLSERPLLVIADAKLPSLGVNSLANLSYQVDVLVDNTGRSPATNVALVPALFLPPGGSGSIPNMLAETCHSADRFGPLSGELVAQGDKSYKISRMPNLAKGGSLRDAVRTAYIEPESRNRVVHARLVVCVLYRSTISSQVHHTAFWYDVGIAFSAEQATEVENGSMRQNETFSVWGDKISLHKAEVINGFAD